VYFDELYGECNETACACVNGGYQSLLSNLLRPGNEATHSLSCIHGATWVAEHY